VLLHIKANPIKNTSMELTVENIIGVLTLTGIYIGLKWWIYQREWNENKDTKDI